MEGTELKDLIAILRDARAQGAAEDALCLLRAIAWESDEEKAKTWRALPLPVRRWLASSIAVQQQQRVEQPIQAEVN